MAKQTLYLNVHANRAAELLELQDLDIASRLLKNRTNPILIASFNGNTKKTRRKLSTINPTWDQVLSLPLKPYDRDSILHLCVWDKHRSYKNYLGELRVDVQLLFSDDDFTPSTELKWYKLHLNDSQKNFITGSLLLSFELVVKEKKRSKAIIKRSKTIDENPTIVENVIVKVDPPSRKNTEQTKNDFLNSFTKMNVSDVELTSVAAPVSQKRTLFSEWKDTLIYAETNHNAEVLDNLGFYSDVGDVTDISLSDIDMASIASDKNSTKGSEPLDLLHKKLLQELLETNDQESISGSSLATDFTESDASSIFQEETSAKLEPESIPTEYSKASKRKKRFSFKKGRHLVPANSNFEVRNRKVDGVLFLEIVSCSDLPPVRNVTGMGRFDMDPFVVVTFGKQTFRTSWKRHSLNPVFNERLAFEVLKQEKTFEVHFLILDKDRFSLHDDVASVSIPLKDLVHSATAAPKSIHLKPEANSDSGGSVEPSQEEFTDTADTEAPQNEKITFVDNKNMVETMEKKLIRKKLKIKYSDTSKFRTMDLALNLENEKYKAKYSPKLKVRVRYETYENLRRSFWERLLIQYDPDNLDGTETTTDKSYDYIELISLLDALGCEKSDEIVGEFFTKNGKLPWGGDTLTIKQLCDCLEEHIIADSTENKLFEIERCPNCLKKRFVNKHDVDIVTHFAVCGSKDWSIVNKLLVSSYVTPQLASKRWFTKVLIKLSYGNYQLGSNSANILVQDRRTGIILEEKMGIYVRLGIRLLYKGLDSAKKRRIRALMKKLSVKQGIKFDDPALKHDISSFVKFHKLDLSECLEPDITKYATFNDFFYRQLKEGARPIEAESDNAIVTSPADCRCVAYETITAASEFWIKGRNFTIPKLFNGNFYDLEDTDVCKADKSSVAVFRLAPQDYHRFHSPVSGVIKKIKFIEGEYYTVNPMAIRSELDVFGENVRALIAIETEKFGTVVMIPVGAMMVGSIVLTKKEDDHIKKGEEMGYFKFGGSTVILLFEKSKFKFDSDLINNSKQCIETLIRVGQSVGHAPSKPEVSREHVKFSKLAETTKKNLIRVITGGDLTDSKEIRSWEVDNLDVSDEEVVDARDYEV